MIELELKLKLDHFGRLNHFFFLNFSIRHRRERDSRLSCKAWVQRGTRPSSFALPEQIRAQIGREKYRSCLSQHLVTGNWRALVSQKAKNCGRIGREFGKVGNRG
jgi:hypothetical protein